MTNLSIFWLEEHKGSSKHTTTPKPAKKLSKRPSSPYSLCHPVGSRKLWQHFPFLSSPNRSPQTSKMHHTNNTFLRRTSTGQHFLGDSHSQKLCTNMLGKGDADFLLQFHCAWPFLLEYRPQGPIPAPSRWKGKPLQHQLFQLGGQPQAIPFW